MGSVAGASLCGYILLVLHTIESVNRYFHGEIWPVILPIESVNQSFLQWEDLTGPVLPSSYQWKQKPVFLSKEQK